MNKISLGRIGTGLVFRNFHLPVLNRLIHQFQIVALCDQNVEKAIADPSAAAADRLCDDV